MLLFSIPLLGQITMTGGRFYICPILTKEPAVFTNGFHSG